MFTLYKLTFSTNKIYIGQTNRNLHLRILQHRRSVRSKSKYPVHLAWAKHGEPTLEVIGNYETQEELDKAEIKAIRKHDCISPNGYNLAIGGNTAPSKSKTVAKKISQKAKGRKYKDTSSWSKATKEKWEDEEYRQSVLDGVSRYWEDSNNRRKHSDAVSKGWKEKVSNGYKMPKMQRDKLSLSAITRAKTKRNTTGYIGVSHHKKRNEYRVNISIDGKNRQIGIFETAIEAAEYRDNYIKKNNLPHTLNF